VDSNFEADWIYYEAARRLFPDTYRGMVGFRPAWFVHVDPDAQFPRYTKTTDLTKPAGVIVGPVEDKHAAARMMEIIEDAFDLCRYHNILVESPNARACAYKEMGKCPAPCDGSVSLEQYRRLVELSASALVDPADYIRDQTRRMQQAAGELRFEIAAKIKAYIEDLSELGKGPFRHARRLGDFTFLSMQRGPNARSAKIFLITPGRIEEIADLIGEPAHPADVLRLAFSLAAERAGAPVDVTGAERIGVVAHHLFQSRQTHGVFLPLDKVDEKAVVKAYRDLQKQNVQDESEGEGVLKELQAM
jgi:excinuclease UvrABC nuclease subunit